MTFNAPEDENFVKTLWEMEKMLVIFSHNVFYERLI